MYITEQYSEAINNKERKILWQFINTPLYNYFQVLAVSFQFIDKHMEVVLIEGKKKLLTKLLPALIEIINFIWQSSYKKCKIYQKNSRTTSMCKLVLLKFTVTVVVCFVVVQQDTRVMLTLYLCEDIEVHEPLTNILKQ